MFIRSNLSTMASYKRQVSSVSYPYWLCYSRAMIPPFWLPFKMHLNRMLTDDHETSSESEMGHGFLIHMDHKSRPYAIWSYLLAILLYDIHSKQNSRPKFHLSHMSISKPHDGPHEAYLPVIKCPYTSFPLPQGPHRPSDQYRSRTYTYSSMTEWQTYQNTLFT